MGEEEVRTTLIRSYAWQTNELPKDEGPAAPRQGRASRPPPLARCLRSEGKCGHPSPMSHRSGDMHVASRPQCIFSSSRPPARPVRSGLGEVDRAQTLSS